MVKLPPTYMLALWELVNTDRSWIYCARRSGSCVTVDFHRVWYVQSCMSSRGLTLCTSVLRSFDVARSWILPEGWRNVQHFKCLKKFNNRYVFSNYINPYCNVEK